MRYGLRMMGFVLLGAATGGCGDSMMTADSGGKIDLRPAAARDLSVPPGADIKSVSEGGTTDDAAALDLSATPDLSVAPDLMPLADLTPPVDLVPAVDLLVPLPDLTPLPDLMPLPDLTPLPDFMAPPDLMPPADLYVPTCMDKVKNGTETDVDCGGSCPPCAVAKSCLIGADCVTSICDTKVCRYPQQCLELHTAQPVLPDGTYTIQPGGPQGGIAPFQTVCDMSTDKGGWTLIGKGREGWAWSDAGKNVGADLLNYTTNAVSYLPSAVVRSIMGGKTWDQWTSKLRIIRKSGVNDKYFYAPKTQVTFGWAVLEDSRHGCGNVAVNSTQADWKEVGGLNLMGTADLLDNLSGGGVDQGNDCSRVFTPPWASHNCVVGFSAGASCVGSSDCWQNGSEAHCIPQTSVWVRD